MHHICLRARLAVGTWRGDLRRAGRFCETLWLSRTSEVAACLVQSVVFSLGGFNAWHQRNKVNIPLCERGPVYRRGLGVFAVRKGTNGKPVGESDVISRRSGHPAGGAHGTGCLTTQVWAGDFRVAFSFL